MSIRTFKKKNIHFRNSNFFHILQSMISYRVKWAMQNKFCTQFLHQLTSSQGTTFFRICHILISCVIAYTCTPTTYKNKHFMQTRMISMIV